MTEQAADNNDMTVSQLFEAWLTSEKDNFTEETLRTTYLSYLAFLKPAFGDRKVNAIFTMNGKSSPKAFRRQVKS